MAGKMLRVTVEEPVDAVISSAGGLPYDCNFMQALKAVFNVADIVRPGGAILWIAQCPQGIHQGFLRWAEIESNSDLQKAVRSEYALTGHNSIMLRQLTDRAQVALLSDLPRDTVIAKACRWAIRPTLGSRMQRRCRRQRGLRKHHLRKETTHSLHHH